MKMSASYTSYKINGGYPVQETIQSNYQQSDQQRHFTRKDQRWMCSCCGYEFLNPNIKDVLADHDIIASQNRDQINDTAALWGQTEYTGYIRDTKAQNVPERRSQTMLTPMSRPTEANVTNHNKDLNSLLDVLEEKRDLKRKVKCKMCFENNTEYVMMPCKHFVCCTLCVARMRSCIVCSTPVKAVHIAKLVNCLPKDTHS